MKKSTWLTISVIGVLLLAGLAVCVLLLKGGTDSQSLPAADTQPPDTMELNLGDIAGFTPQENWIPTAIGELNIVSAGSYSGPFLEDGSDEAVDSVLALIVQNIGTELVEYGEVTAQDGEKTCTFVFTALPSNAYVLVLEKDRRGYGEMSDPQVTELAKAFDVIMDYASAFEIHLGDGVINIVNISGRDFASEIFVYYKTYQNGVYMGGITYRARFSGLANEAIGQSIQSHASAADTVVMYMAYEE